MRLLRAIIKPIPVLLILLSLIESKIVSTDLYNEVYKYNGDINGYSLFTDLFMLYFIFYHRMCMYDKVSVIGLIALNILSILHHKFNLGDYYDIYDLVVSSIFSCLAIILFIKKK